MAKKKPTPTKAEAGHKQNTQQPIGQNDYKGTDCITGDCYDDNQKTFVDPCPECDQFTLPSRASREGQILTDLARGDWLTNQTIYEQFGGTHDGRKRLSTLRKDYGLLIEHSPVQEGRSDRKHRIKPACLPYVQRRLANVWGLNLQAAASASKAKDKTSSKPRLQRRGG